MDSISAPDSVPPPRPVSTTAGGGSGQYRSRRFLMVALYCVPFSGGLRRRSSLETAAAATLQEDVWVVAGAEGERHPQMPVALLLLFVLLFS